MTEKSVTLEFIAERLNDIQDEQRLSRERSRRLFTMQTELATCMTHIASRIDAIATRIGHLENDPVTTIRAEIGGLFAHLETRLEQRIGDEIRERLTQ